MNEQIALARSNQRCEWIHLDGERCQNAMSLKLHHRTYIRFGREFPEDFTVFCPAHHNLADVMRKIYVNQKREIIEERVDKVISATLAKLDRQTAKKYLLRLTREWEHFYIDEQVGGSAYDLLFDFILNVKFESRQDYESLGDTAFLCFFCGLQYVDMLNRMTDTEIVNEFNSVRSVTLLREWVTEDVISYGVPIKYNPFKKMYVYP